MITAMILKQNCYVLSDAELNALETDNYISPKKTTFTGSAIQRRFKVTEQINQNEKKKVNKNDLLKEHTMSSRTKAKIRQKLTAWSNCIPKKQAVKFTFLTLTLTSKQRGTDRLFTKMQNTLFTNLRTLVSRNQASFNFKNYLYVLEKQKNGNIHSHIIISSYVPIGLINRLWCKILSDNGYTFDQLTYKTGQKIRMTPLEALTKHFQSEKNVEKWGCYCNVKTREEYVPSKVVTCPSPADITMVYNFKKVSSYITKYITKNETTLNTQIWNCSSSISQLWTGARICAKKYLLELEQFKLKTITKMMDNGQNMYINILREYTGLQKRLFSEVNMPYLFA